MRALLTFAVAILCLGQPAAAQTLPGSDPGSSIRTRADLERLLAEHEQALASSAYSESAKAMIRVEADALRARLENGDFRAGDKITLIIEGEPNMPDTLDVESGPAIDVVPFGRISLRGVLRSEINEHLERELSRYIQNPVVRAYPHLWLSVQGEVGNPGFYAIPADMLFGEALMEAGGPTTSAVIGDAYVDRGSRRLMEGEQLREAIRSGLTLDQLNLQAGDEIVVPGGSGGSFLINAGVIAGILGSVTGLIVLFVR